MKNKSIFKQLLIPMVAIVVALCVVLTAAIVATVSKSYEKEIANRNLDKTKLVAGEISAFMDGAFSLTEEISKSPSILTMKTEDQNPILADCVGRNAYLELLYIQGTDGMQTGRSSGTLADRSTRWWFIQTMEQKKSFVSKSYYSVNTGMPCASIFFPMYRQQEMIGVFAVDIKLDYLQSLIEQFSNEKNGEYSFVIDGEGVVVAHPDSTQIEELYNYVKLTKTVSLKDDAGNPKTDEKGNILTEEQPITLSASYKKVIEDVMSGHSNHAKITNNGVSYYVSYAPISLKGDSDSWSVITVQKVSKAMSMVNFILLIALVASIVAVAVAVIIITKLAQHLTSPIVSLTSLVTAAADGDFSQQADENNSSELGALAVGFNKMSKKIASTLGDMNSIGLEVVQSSDKLSEVQQSANSVNQAVTRIKDGSDKQTGQVNDVINKASELDSKFAELGVQSDDLLKIVKGTVDSEQQGEASIKELEKANQLATDSMSEAFKKIAALEEQSQRISGIVGTIDDIASQTSLLALNASIEAARAGEQGRGFAVVAESIGKLANDSSDATSTISQIIVELCGDIESTVANIQTVNEVMENQSAVVGKVEGSFTDFKSLAGRTQSAMEEIQKLVDQMSGISKDIVTSVDKIREISNETDGITDEVAAKLAAQLDDIELVAKRINKLSEVTGK